MKQTLIPAQMLTVEQQQEIIKTAQDLAIKAVVNKSGIKEENLVTRMLNPQLDAFTVAPPAAGRIAGLALGNGVNLARQDGWKMNVLIPLVAGVIQQWIPPFTIPDDMAIVIAGFVDNGISNLTPADRAPILAFVQFLTGGGAIIDEVNMEAMQTYWLTDEGVVSYLQTVQPYLDEDIMEVRMAPNRAVPAAAFVDITMIAFVVEKYGRVINKKS